MAAQSQREAQEVSAAFHAAMIYLGIKTLDEALDAWSVVPPTPGQAPAALGRWIVKAMSQALKRHDKARELAMAYYRLHRAIQTGSTIEHYSSPSQATVTLGELRDEFHELVTEVGAPAPTSEMSHAALERADREGDEPPRAQRRKSLKDDKKVVKVEKTPDLKQAIKAEREAVEDALRASLEVTGANSLTLKLRAIPSDEPAKTVDEKRDKAHSTAGHTQAATAARHAMNGSRSVIHLAAEKDKRAIGWVRVSGTGSPCGFCAMLISRGVFYKSEKAAVGESPDSYHDNCFCYAEPVYSRAQFASDPRFALNRQLRSEWQSLIADKGYKGNTALNKWRTHIRQRNAGASKTTTQEVA